ncbi:FK506-binding protein 15-like isoform X2 [Maniola jurtina]|uniref:FK506-binding protein 15-like isoform X2 n=1 Tax=Maniola jurtina TaxID=191418 RepID=UPI001E687D0F|nr:FK506-binding protein 15-like isoform X2 [Maniola jurtina]
MYGCFRIKNSYEFRGKLGFAIFKIPSIDIYKMLIYDSNKTALSSLTINHSVEIKINGNISICYYDDLRKFWSVNPSTPNLKEILEILRSLNVNLEFVPILENTENKTLTERLDKDKIAINKINEDEKESDTDGSFNRKTKDSILKRMATMGQSVLPPPHAAAVAQTSDSSDTNEPQNQQKPRHKPKIVTKKNSLEKKSLDTEKISELNARKMLPKSEISQDTYRNIEDYQQIVPVLTTNIVKTPNDFGGEASSLRVFISEQKVSNSELRMNMNRMTDKLDMLLDKVKDLDIVDKSKSINNSYVSHFQNEIIQKLLSEYEKKINKYEEFIKLKGFDCDSFELTSQLRRDSTLESLKNTEKDDNKLQQLCNEKDKEIIRLKEELQLLSNKEAQFQTNERNLLKEINDLKNSLSVTKYNHMTNVNKKLDETNSQTTDITNKLKQIMNDTFQAISVNFDDDETYTGSKIKSVVGLIVKKTTIDSLKEF